MGSLLGILESELKNIEGDVSSILDKALDGREVNVEEGAKLFGVKAGALTLLLLTADYLRKKSVGDFATFVVNRNINFTNVCVKRCGFCAFSRDHRTEEGYFLPISEVVRRAKEARAFGATEVCIQAGLAPSVSGELYPALVRSIKKEVPELHIHAFSPEEVKYGSKRMGVSYKEFLLMLKEAGIGSLPGTSAEILDQRVRDLISPGRIKVDEWVEIIRTAHLLGIPTTSTIMYGHVETDLERAKHIALIREIQKETRGFTEFVPLSLVHWEAPMYTKKLLNVEFRLPTGADVLRMYAVSRVMLNGYISNIQVSWVKEGPRFSQIGLLAGANDMGGTLMNESISTAAGAANGQLVRPKEFIRMATDLNRIPAERSTLYKIIHIHSSASPSHPLDSVSNPEEVFGSYQKLVRASEHRFINSVNRGVDIA
ncbi:7,8-didemethyl-8-hydroxy-5-deazariboflavin synthase subunit CofH [Candidatus Marsarchaeota G2 archaeon ECH_B_SAG-C16]|jgi:7,8-didemethyl-8-hydroxy-5-deazariboflavin synthase CofH subunit|uniref:5-amino-6-(D-ribitylamino)uracil--L-tyrosine 4-hydroxyphenyl transferase n=4 Tax=Candidatus Marsarchaeota group 2 TaxID=2203771 RepID=A0A2R6B8G1_9ARCH|nr:MAG: 7,8-didemethyl-8-hydroxy-5-deazariboflavin synthase subunit CofH [Candidatus Marsarchaeota G2 archaeon ECH_B_2]PSN95429.1 MAG: 7,8-didemethyl-8-hydroxy-5-deazariboflavin synthase subunit CofH [Candidatus Marsarchaeota G2 archaeon ECH_B_SAG-C16]PSN99442.1 MAG: 7,8-didemethyl-8-hydroxy-5-deazariboflavin synthase subunit CofH [Candidatus Marsarchaeota G2 archaeon ECH_B_3]PSO01689.1 MAG: 7,8-didemethyl-8-hydroxy-5-deazariboflavin synthase subunit CofH [Candidatus Marsarchaeota G2 archaeon EC